MKLGLPPEREASKELPRVLPHGARSYATGGPIPPERLWLRAAAFGIDLLVLAGIPLLLATGIVFGLLLAIPDASPRVGLGFRVAQGAFLVAFLLRDAWGASPGKRLLGLKVTLEKDRSGALASVARNLLLIVPVWNVVEALSVLRCDQRRLGDRLAGTSVSEA